MRGGGDSFEIIEANLDEYAGGGTLDRVVVNKPSSVWMRIYTFNGNMYSFAIMNDNDVFQTKYLASMYTYIGSLSIGYSLHIVVENVTKNMGTSLYEDTVIRIGNGSNINAIGTWTSTIVPENVTMELDCKVVEMNGNIVTAKCDSKTMWSESVFNRIYMGVYPADNNIHMCANTPIQRLFGYEGFGYSGSIPSGEWSQYNVTGSGSSIIVGNQLTIMNVPKSFVSHWANMGAQALMGNNRIILVPPDGS